MPRQREPLLTLSLPAWFLSHEPRGPLVLCDQTCQVSAAEAEFVFERIAIVLESGESLRTAESTALTQLCQHRAPQNRTAC